MKLGPWNTGLLFLAILISTGDAFWFGLSNWSSLLPFTYNLTTDSSNLGSITLYVKPRSSRQARDLSNAEVEGRKFNLSSIFSNIDTSNSALFDMARWDMSGLAVTLGSVGALAGLMWAVIGESLKYKKAVDAGLIDPDTVGRPITRPPNLPAAGPQYVPAPPSYSPGYMMVPSRPAYSSGYGGSKPAKGGNPFTKGVDGLKDMFDNVPQVFKGWSDGFKAVRDSLPQLAKLSGIQKGNKRNRNKHKGQQPSYYPYYPPAIREPDSYAYGAGPNDYYAPPSPPAYAPLPPYVPPPNYAPATLPPPPYVPPPTYAPATLPPPPPPTYTPVIPPAPYQPPAPAPTMAPAPAPYQPPPAPYQPPPAPVPAPYQPANLLKNVDAPVAPPAQSASNPSLPWPSFTIIPPPSNDWPVAPTLPPAPAVDFQDAPAPPAMWPPASSPGDGSMPFKSSPVDPIPFVPSVQYWPAPSQTADLSRPLPRPFWARNRQRLLDQLPSDISSSSLSTDLPMEAVTAPVSTATEPPVDAVATETAPSLPSYVLGSEERNQDATTMKP